MAAKSTTKPVAESIIPWENPLIPNKRLRRLYSAMVEVRLLEEHLAKKAARKPSLHAGEEACFVSTVLSLLPGDITSESSAGVAIRFLRGSKLANLLHRRTVPEPRKSGELPAMEDTAARLHVATGTALALADTKTHALVVFYVHADDLESGKWKPILILAASCSAPILFVVLPRSGSASKPGRLSLFSSKCGVPGIPVDASDPIALYRVAQESMLRVRAGGGPVLMECIPFGLPGKANSSADPIARMQELLLPRKVAAETWFQGVPSRFTARLIAAAQ